MGSNGQVHNWFRHLSVINALRGLGIFPPICHAEAWLRTMKCININVIRLYHSIINHNHIGFPYSGM